MWIFLIESKKVVMDYIIQMHDQYITNITRACKNIHETRLKQYKRRNERALHSILGFMDYALELSENKNINWSSLYANTSSKECLLDARNDMRLYEIESKYGYPHLLQNRYGSMRKYFLDFIQLPFLGEAGTQELLEAIDIIKKLDNGKLLSLPAQVPTSFIDNTIQQSLKNKDGDIKRNLWEIGVAIAIKDAFRSGVLFIEKSNKYTSFWNMVYDENQWIEVSDRAYIDFGIEKDPKQFSKTLQTTFNHSIKQCEKQFNKDNFSDVKDGKLFLKKKDKIDEPDDVKRLQSLINSYLPKIKIEQLLIEVDKMTGFTKHFTPIHGQKREQQHSYKCLISSILAQAMNIGFATMQDCTPGITAEMMRHTNDSCIREGTLKKSNAELVNKHTQLSLSKLHGDGTISSSDGQRFIINASSLLASFYPRYCGYYDKIIGIYTHTSDQFSVYNTEAISCSPRESLHVVDGFLNNNTILSIREHTTDTAGYTEHIFALCFLLNIKFMPRIKDLKSQQLYRINKDVSYGVFDSLLTKTISLELIEQQLDSMIRITASMKHKLCPAHEIIRRLSKGSPSDKISKAFTHLGRLIKTQYILQYITDSQLRDKVYLQLNKGGTSSWTSTLVVFCRTGKVSSW
jgi:TnpA family transposase